MRKNVNKENIEGRVYEHDLVIKTVQNQNSENYGKEFIQGTVSVATDEAGLNVLVIHYTYVTPVTKSGAQNVTYSNLKKIMEGKTWVNDGKEEAMKVRMATAAAINDFYPNGGDQLVSSYRNEGGFVSMVNELVPEGISRQKFVFDTIINGANLIEADPEKNIESDYLKINCAIFNYRNELIPFVLIAKDPNAINYFIGLNPSPSNPIYTQVWGEIICTTIKVERMIESAFGTPTVDISERQAREWVITGAKPEPYVFDDETTITRTELDKAIADRNVYLEDVKTRAKEYYNSKNGAETGANAISNPTPMNEIPAGGFNF